MQVCYEDLKKTNASFEADFIAAAQTVISSGWYVLGEAVNRFEKQFAHSHKAKECVSVASGLDALLLSLAALELPENAEVILPANAYIADVLAVKHNGLVPVLIEPSIDTYNLTPEGIEAAITSKTAAIMPIHLYGKPAPMPEIMSIANKYKLAVIEDAAQAHGARISDQYVGTFGTCGAFSFYPTKNLGALGDAGAILTNDTQLAEKLRALRDYGSTQKNVHEYLGFNSRLDTIQAAMLEVKLAALDKISEHKRQLAALYHQLLPACVIKPVVQESVYDVHHIYPIRYPDRDTLKEMLTKMGVMTAIHYPTPVFDQPIFKGQWSGNYPIAREIHNTELSLPISYGHTPEEVVYVCDMINKVLQ